MEKTGKVSKSSVIYLIDGVIVLLFLGLIYAWSIFRPPLQELFPDWTATKVSITFTLSIIFFCLGGFVAGKVANTISHRLPMIASAVLCLIAFTAISLLLDGNAPNRSLITLYIFYGVFFGFAIGLTYNTLLGVILSHFPGRAGIASGFLLFGFGAGGLLIGKIITMLIDSYGLPKTFFILGILFSVILLLASLHIKKHIQTEFQENNSNKDGATTDKTLIQAISKPAFWIVMIWDTSISIGGLLIINSAVPIALQFGMTAITGLIVSVFNGIGRPLIGVMFDTIGRKKTMTINSWLLVVAGLILLGGALTKNSIFIYIGLPLVGLAYGGTPPMISAITNTFYGPKYYQVILATMTFSLVFAATVGPIISSKLQEISGGEYATSFIMLIVVGFVAIALSKLTTIAAKKENLE